MPSLGFRNNFRFSTNFVLFPKSLRKGAYFCFLKVSRDDDRRLVASDVTAYVNKNQYRVVQFPFKVRISKTNDVKRIIGDKPV